MHHNQNHPLKILYLQPNHMPEKTKNACSPILNNASDAPKKQGL